jgi:hypothetical protein
LNSIDELSNLKFKLILDEQTSAEMQVGVQKEAD